MSAAIDAVGMFDGVLVVGHFVQRPLVRQQPLAFDDDSRPLPPTDGALERPTFSAMEHPMAYTKNRDDVAFLHVFFPFFTLFERNHDSVFVSALSLFTRTEKIERKTN